MVIVQGRLISDAIFQEQFLCNLSACKGACCWEGDFGAPLEEEEKQTLAAIHEVIRPFLSEEGNRIIEKVGPYSFYEEPQEFGTPLLENGACAYMITDELGIAKCGIEKAYQTGVTDFIKPISCHLYPIRVNKDESKNFEALNYDEWEICSAACEKGRQEQLPVFRFVKIALTRKYGEAFYEELEAYFNEKILKK